MQGDITSSFSSETEVELYVCKKEKQPHAEGAGQGHKPRCISSAVCIWHLYLKTHTKDNPLHADSDFKISYKSMALTQQGNNPARE